MFPSSCPCVALYNEMVDKNDQLPCSYISIRLLMGSRHLFFSLLQDSYNKMKRAYESCLSLQGKGTTFRPRSTRFWTYPIRTTYRPRTTYPWTYPRARTTSRPRTTRFWTYPTHTTYRPRTSYPWRTSRPYTYPTRSGMSTRRPNFPWWYRTTKRPFSTRTYPTIRPTRYYTRTYPTRGYPTMKTTWSWSFWNPTTRRPVRVTRYYPTATRFYPTRTYPTIRPSVFFPNRTYPTIRPTKVYTTPLYPKSTYPVA